MSQRLNSKGVESKITDFYHLPENSTKTESRRGFRAVVSYGKRFNAPNELFLTVDTAWNGEMRRGENYQGGREIHNVEEKEKVGFCGVR